MAECREHKRWIERENTRLRAKAKKEETRRLREFVDRAYALDPRVAAKKEEARAEREEKKAAKERVRKEKEDAERRAAEEAAAAKAAADDVAKKAAADAKRVKCVLRCVLCCMIAQVHCAACCSARREPEQSGGTQSVTILRRCMCFGGHEDGWVHRPHCDAP